MAQYLLHTFKGIVGGGNSTFYKLTREGRVRLVLESRTGDADLYISDKTLHPDFTNYEYQSVTCGEDEVEIPVHFQRPVGIAVYGHPSQEVSKYLLSVTVEDTPTQSSGHSSSQGGGSHHHSHTPSGSLPGAKEEEESVLWTIFVGILKIIFDILM